MFHNAEIRQLRLLWPSHRFYDAEKSHKPALGGGSFAALAIHQEQHHVVESVLETKSKGGATSCCVCS
jgi:hypothetical protein